MELEKNYFRIRHVLTWFFITSSLNKARPMPASTDANYEMWTTLDATVLKWIPLYLESFSPLLWNLVPLLWRLGNTFLTSPR